MNTPIADPKRMSFSSASPFTTPGVWSSSAVDLSNSICSYNIQLLNNQAPPQGPWHTAYFSQTPSLRSNAPLTTSILDAFSTQSKSLSLRFGQKLSQIANMRDNWDDEGAKAANVDLVANTYGVILLLKTMFGTDFKEPFLAPTFHGSVLAEWQGPKRSLEFEATKEGWSVVGSSVLSDGQTLYHETDLPRSNLSTLIDCYKWFIGTEMLWPTL
jgi:hypothetical protein